MSDSHLTLSAFPLPVPLNYSVVVNPSCLLNKFNNPKRLVISANSKKFVVDVITDDRCSTRLIYMSRTMLQSMSATQGSDVLIEEASVLQQASEVTFTSNCESSEDFSAVISQYFADKQVPISFNSIMKLMVPEKDKVLYFTPKLQSFNDVCIVNDSTSIRYVPYDPYHYEVSPFIKEYIEDTVLSPTIMNELVKYIRKPVNNSGLLGKFGFNRSNCVVICGESGSGKSTIINSLGNFVAAGRNNPPYVCVLNGESLRKMDFRKAVSAMNEKFLQAIENRPSVIAIDDADILLTDIRAIRDYGELKILSLFRHYLDTRFTTPDITVVAAVSDYKRIDPSFLSSSKFNLQVNLEKPDRSVREEIVKKYFTDLPTQSREAARSKIESGVDLSAADIESICDIEVSKVFNGNSSDEEKYSIYRNICDRNGTYQSSYGRVDDDSAFVSAKYASAINTVAPSNMDMFGGAMQQQTNNQFSGSFMSDQFADPFMSSRQQHVNNRHQQMGGSFGGSFARSHDSRVPFMGPNDDDNFKSNASKLFSSNPGSGNDTPSSAFGVMNVGSSSGGPGMSSLEPPGGFHTAQSNGVGMVSSDPFANTMSRSLQAPSTFQLDPFSSSKPASFEAPSVSPSNPFANAKSQPFDTPNLPPSDPFAGSKPQPFDTQSVTSTDPFAIPIQQSPGALSVPPLNSLSSGKQKPSNITDVTLSNPFDNARSQPFDDPGDLSLDALGGMLTISSATKSSDPFKNMSQKSSLGQGKFGGDPFSSMNQQSNVSQGSFGGDPFSNTGQQSKLNQGGFGGDPFSSMNQQSNVSQGSFAVDLFSNANQQPNVVQSGFNNDPFSSVNQQFNVGQGGFGSDIFSSTNQQPNVAQGGSGGDPFSSISQQTNVGQGGFGGGFNSNSIQQPALSQGIFGNDQFASYSDHNAPNNLSYPSQPGFAMQHDSPSSVFQQQGYQGQTEVPGQSYSPFTHVLPDDPFLAMHQQKMNMVPLGPLPDLIVRSKSEPPAPDMFMDLNPLKKKAK